MLGQRGRNRLQLQQEVWMGSKSSGMKFPSRDVHCPVALGEAPEEVQGKTCDTKYVRFSDRKYFCSFFSVTRRHF